MIVCTPLSRTVRVVLIEALISKKTFAVHGPAGSGKTETINHTCRMLGMEPPTVSVASCLDAPTEAINAAIKAASSECHMIFDGFNRLPSDAMAAIAEASAARTFCALTFNPMYHAANALPESLQARVFEMEIDKLASSTPPTLCQG